MIKTIKAFYYHFKLEYKTSIKLYEEAINLNYQNYELFYFKSLVSI
jgi:hypothetical protein